MKTYLVDNGDGSYTPLKSKTAPQGSVGILPKGERVDWVDIVEELDDLGVSRQVVKVDDARKTKFKSDRKAKQDKEDLDRKEKRDSDNELIDILKNVKRADVSTSAERQQVILDIIKLITKDF